MLRLNPSGHTVACTLWRVSTTSCGFTWRNLRKRWWSAGGALEEAGRVFVEAFSDVTVQKTDRLICIQVKRSLTSATLRDAAAEFAAIESFFEQKYPAQGSRLRFELVASRGDAGRGWGNLSASAPERKVVDELLRQGRLAQPRVEVDPGWKAIVAVWTHLDDPYDFFRFALDRCLSRSLSPEDAVRARDDICERFARGRRTPAAVGQLLKPTDFVSSEKLTTRLEIGREITLKRMQDQQYMLRQHRRDALFAALEERYELAGNDLQLVARVFWLSGRSGVGKSVLLLQVVERLVHSGRRVLWLGGAAEKLEPALRLFAEQPDALRPEVIAIDDLYDRDARTRLDLAGLGSFIDEAGPRSWPLILTCGPVEFAEAFRDESRFRGFELHLETIHPVAVDESRLRIASVCSAPRSWTPAARQPLPKHRGTTVGCSYRWRSSLNTAN